MSEKTIRWYNTIGIKVVLVIIASCVLVLGGLSAYTTISDQKALENNLDQLAETTAQRLSKHLIGPMWDLDKGQVEDTIEAEMLENRIHAIIIWDTETGELFAARQRGIDGQPERSNGSVNGDMIKATAMVNNGAKDIGEAIVFVSKKELTEQLHQSTLNGLLTLVILIVVMVTIMTVVMSKMIIAPIGRLAKHADDISHGDLKHDIQAASNDEIGQLADAFQRMQISLRFAFKRLNSKT